MSNLRLFIRRVHLWLGLSLGLLLALLGLTGSLLIFYVEIDAALNPAVRVATDAPAPDWESPVWDQVMATARRHYPDPHGEWSLEATDEPGAIPARFYPGASHGDHHAEREMVWFSPDGRQVLRSDTWGSYTMSFIYEVHMHLIAGEPGRLVVGWGGLATLLVLITGIVSWWPRGSWRNALSFKRRAMGLRRLRDLHKHSGVWSSLVVILLVITGVLLALPEVKAPVLTALIARPDPVPAPQSEQAQGTQVTLARALAAGHAARPQARLAFIDVPTQGSAPIRLRVQMPGDPHRRFPGSFIFVDQHTGQVLAVHDTARGNAATRVATWIRPLHDGSIAGTSTRVLVLVLGLAPVVLLITGFLFWRRRRSRRAARPLLHSSHTGRNS
jgi:uncharacterized iron-regulated membrane protein